MATAKVMTAACCILLLCVSAPLRAEAQDYVAEFSAVPNYYWADLSPDGRLVAIAMPESGGDRVVIMSIGSNEQPRAFKMNHAAIHRVDWYGDEKIIVRTNVFLPRGLVMGGVRVLGWNEVLYVIDLGSDTPPVELDRPATRSKSQGQIVDFDHDDEDNIFLTAANFNGRYTKTSLVQANIVTGKITFVRTGHEGTADWIMDGEGNLLAHADLAENGNISIWISDDADGYELAEIDTHVVGTTEDARSLIVSKRDGNGRLALYPIDLQTGQKGDALFANPDVDFSFLLQDNRTLRITGVLYFDGLLMQSHYFDSERQAMQERLSSLLPGQSVQLLSVSDDKTKALVAIFARRIPVRLGYVDFQTGSAELLLDSLPALQGIVLGDVQPVEYTTSDDLQLTGLLTVPPGVVAENLPLVVLDTAATSPNFNQLAHLLALNGYAVLQPGARQVRSFGDVADIDEMARLIDGFVNDVAGGVDSLVSQRVVDPSRVCIVGESESALLALETVANRVDLFSCAISIDGLMDLNLLLEWARTENRNGVLGYYFKFVRAYENFDEDALELYSPTHHAERLSVPVLVTAADDDEHSRSLARALRRAGGKYETAYYGRDRRDPNKSREEVDADKYSAILNFLQAHIGNRD